MTGVGYQDGTRHKEALRLLLRTPAYEGGKGLGVSTKERSLHSLRMRGQARATSPAASALAGIRARPHLSSEIIGAGLECDR